MLCSGLLLAGAGTCGLLLAGRTGHGALPVGRPAAPVAAGKLTPLPHASSRHRVARPVDLIIPVIGVRTRLVHLAVTPTGDLQVPATPTVAGWYTASPPPGAIGSSIIAGHVDSRSGPGIFFRLRLLRRGDSVYVRRADGSLAVFGVTAVKMYPKDRFPAAAVYGPTPDAELRLITCGGTFDQSLGSYLSNVVVYATAVAG